MQDGDGVVQNFDGLTLTSLESILVESIGNGAMGNKSK